MGKRDIGIRMFANLTKQDGVKTKLAACPCVGRQIIHQDAVFWLRFSGDLQRDLKSRLHWFAVWVNRLDIHDRLETVFKTQCGQYTAGVIFVCIGEDELAQGEHLKHILQGFIRLQVFMQGNIVYKGQVFIQIHVIMSLQPPQGGAVFVKILLAQGWNFLPINPQMLVHVQVHTLFD